MGEILGKLEPKLVWEIFEEITKFPRPSKKEEKIVRYLENFADKHGFPVKKDELGNLVISKPATTGYENRPKVCIQAHVDMVTEKNRDVEFDFENDAIQPYVDGDWVKAKGTTLGADNGVGLAMGLAVLISDEVEHGPYELLCTLDEETGLTGAMQLGEDLLESDILINLDTEEDGHFTIGCAGGINTIGTLEYLTDKTPEDCHAFEIGIKGLQGGHSGLEINDGRANPIKLLSRTLIELTRKFNIRLSSINGGDKHNAMPREAYSVIMVNNEKLDDMKNFIEEFRAVLENEWKSKEPGIQLILEDTKKPEYLLSKKSQIDLIESFNVMPHGVLRMSPDIEGLVQTSTNFARVRTTDNVIEVLTSQRSSVESEKFYAAQMISSSLLLGQFEVEVGEGYPSWQPKLDSPLVTKAKDLYNKMYDKDPVIEVIHAGLECGLIGEKYPNMEMISFGPTLRDVHTPSEKVEISSTKKCWEFLVEFLKKI